MTRGTKRILLAEDQESTSFPLRIRLQLAGFHVDEARDGAEAFRKISYSQNIGHPFHLLITDLYMPNLSGMRLMEKLRRNGISVPVITTSGFGNDEIEQELKRLGSSRFLHKPVAMEELLATIDTLLNHKEAPAGSA